MSRRIAHRPRYHYMRPVPHPSLRSHKDFLRNRWTYRRQNIPYQKRSPGQGLLLVPTFNPLRLLPTLPRLPSLFAKTAFESRYDR
jgi:hypothetical protein